MIPLLLATTGCDEWQKYWDEEQHGRLPDEIPPTVAVTAPTGPDTASATPVSGTYEVNATASDDRDLQRVDLYVDGARAGAFSRSGSADSLFTFDWDTAPIADGSVVEIVAKAIDTADNSSMSPATFAQVFNSGPAITITSPEDGAFAQGDVNIVAELVNPGDDVEKIEFLLNDELIETVTSPPFETMISTAILDNGAHVILAKSFGPTGGARVSDPIQILVNDGAPSATITFPDAGYQLAPGGTMPFSVNAVDDVQGPLGGEDVVWRSEPGGTLGTGAYFRHAFEDPGTFVITARATNGWGSADSAQTTVEVLAQATRDYCRDIYFEILEPSCVATGCHTPGSTEFDESLLDMSTYAGLMRGGINQDIHPCVVPCKPDSSFLMNKIDEFQEPWTGERMPPDELPLDEELVGFIRTWIAEGAPPNDPQICD